LRFFKSWSQSIAAKDLGLIYLTELLLHAWDLGPTKVAGLKGETVVEFGSEARIGVFLAANKVG
jgi:hypothetical protein